MNFSVCCSRRLACTFLSAQIIHATPALQAGQRSAEVPNRVPGVIIDHSAAFSGIFIGSPSLAVLSNGDLIASHDEFGPLSSEARSGITHVFGSTDAGSTWRKVSTVRGQYWSTLFVHRGALYLLGTDRHLGNVVIRRSSDGGLSWTSPMTSAVGLLSSTAGYHCAPVPVLEYGGRLWRAFERRDTQQGSGGSLCAGMLSAPAESDLLNATNWTATNFLPGKTNWLSGTFGGWLEGNAVVTGDGELLDILRVDTSGLPEKAALVHVTANVGVFSFDPSTGFIDFPGGAKKFTIRYDSVSQRFWSVASIVAEPSQASKPPSSIRNTLALTCSSDLTKWAVCCVLLGHPDADKHGFQYVDWLFQGEDIIAVCRTAYDDEGSGAHSYHDANFLTFHRWRNFRKLTSNRTGGI